MNKHAPTFIYRDREDNISFLNTGYLFHHTVQNRSLFLLGTCTLNGIQGIITMLIFVTLAAM
jgi:hypothetical protein